MLLAIAWPGSAAETLRGELSVSAPGDPLRGEFALDRSNVVFSAERRPEGVIKANFQVNGLLFDLDYDTASATLHFDGHGNAFSVEDHLVLEALADKLDGEWDGYALRNTQERFWIFRVILLLSEAPVGFRHETWSMEVPSQADVQPYAAPGKPLAPPSGPEEEVLGCVDRDDQDGIRVHPNSCNGPRRIVTWHDACPDHGFVRDRPLGLCSLATNCLARCGIGCGSYYGRGIYTHDCGDRDNGVGGEAECDAPRSNEVS